MPSYDEVSDDNLDQLERFVAAYGPEGEGVAELAGFRIMGIKPRNERTGVAITKPDENGRLPCSAVRMKIWENLLGKEYPVLAKVAACVMSMPVTACASERNWSQWGQVYVKARSNLGLERASDIIYIKQNDRLARGKPADMGDLAVLLDTLNVL